MWIYSQTTGNLTAPDGSLAGTGYSGNGVALNDPGSQSIKGHGPIPQGMYGIGVFYDDPEKGPLVCRLAPHPDNVMFGRDGFMIHGDNAAANHTASDGCIVLSHAVRELIADEDEDLDLQVTS